MCAPVLIQQFTHLVCIPIALTPLSENYPRLSYLLFGRDRKIQEKDRKRTDKAKNSEIRFRREVKQSSVALWVRIACFARLKPSLVVAGQSAVQQTPCERQVVLLKMLFCHCRLPRRLVETEYTPAPGVCSRRAKKHPHWLEEDNSLPSPSIESQLVILWVHLTLYRSSQCFGFLRPRIDRG